MAQDEVVSNEQFRERAIQFLKQDEKARATLALMLTTGTPITRAMVPGMGRVVFNNATNQREPEENS